MPSTMLLVRRKGTSSGVFRKRPCSKATPKSMCTTSAVLRSSSMLWLCLSPRPMMYPVSCQRFLLSLFKRGRITASNVVSTCNWQAKIDWQKSRHPKARLVHLKFEKFNKCSTVMPHDRQHLHSSLVVCNSHKHHQESLLIQLQHNSKSETHLPLN